MEQRHAFVTDVPDLSTFAWPEDLRQEAADEYTPPTSRIQVARVGKFSHPRYGKFAITRDTFDSFVKNLTAGVVGDRLPGDFDHEPDMGGSTKACGWLTSLEPDSDALWGNVQWTWEGACAIRDGSYRWISPTWSMAYVDDEGTKHGPTLLAFALTNRPFFSRMAAVSLSQSFSTAFAGIADLTTEDAEDTASAPSTPDPASYRRAFDATLPLALATLPQGRDQAHVTASLERLYAADPDQALRTLHELLRRVG